MKKWSSVCGTDNPAWKADDGGANKAKSGAISKHKELGAQYRRAMSQGSDWKLLQGGLPGEGAAEPKPE